MCTFSSDNWFIDARFRKCVEQCPTKAVVFDWTKRTCEVCDDDSTNHDCLTSMYLKIKSKYLRGYGMNFYFHNIRAPFATTCSFFIQIHQTKFFLWYFGTFMSIFTKKVFSVMFHIGGIPGRRNDFFRKIVHAKRFTGFISQYFLKNSTRRC